MPAADEDFAYAILRVVPDLARGEALNAGVVSSAAAGASWAR